MASSRRGQPPLTVHLPPPAPGGLPDLPAISALFLIEFDVKAGYTIAWKKAEPGVELEGLVEYKSLPSGLHTVSEDLIYFVHDRGHAGLSAFVNIHCEEEAARNARMIAVGVLVPLSEGRLGRAWRHAQGLKEIASTIAEHPKRIELLEAFWEKNKATEGPAESLGPSAETPLEPPLLKTQTDRLKKGHSRNRSASDGTALIPPGHQLSPFHPAWSLVFLLDTFGPLIFPIHRAAMLRKRILISCQTPVHEVCNYVYNISVLSNIPHSVAEILDPSASSQRLRPLFCIGVHDISFLLEDYEASKRVKSSQDEAVADDAGTGWIACTTDSILAMKDTLWDMLITLPPAYATGAKDRAWPTVECPRGVPVRATQRDLRRFRALKNGLGRLNATATTTPRPRTVERSPSVTSGSIKLTTGAFPSADAGVDDSLDKVVEPVSWAALAYSGFLWWASAGEQGRSDEHEEAVLDNSLLADLAPSPSPSHPRTPAAVGLGDSLASLTKRRSTTSVTGGDSEEEAKTELAIIAYFHRLTTQILSVMADVVEAAEETYEPYTDDEDGDEPRTGAGGARGDDEEDVPLNPGSGSDEEDVSLPVVQVGTHAVESMGLDVWNGHDAEFVKELAVRYFAREARIEGKGVEVCGVRVC